jgi:hypothetical protein
MIDQNRDGFIDHDDLKDMLASLGKVRHSWWKQRHLQIIFKKHFRSHNPFFLFPQVWPVGWLSEWAQNYSENTHENIYQL